MGYSTGRWDGDTLVVETTGFNGKSWLDQLGRPTTDKLRVTERFTRTHYGHLRIDVTIDDPGAYTAPWSASQVVHLRPGWEPLEFICGENNKDVENLPGQRRCGGPDEPRGGAAERLSRLGMRGRRPRSESASALSRAAMLALAAFVAPSSPPRSTLPAFDERQRQILDKIEADSVAATDRTRPRCSTSSKADPDVSRERASMRWPSWQSSARCRSFARTAGCYTLEQVPLLWQRIESEEARGNDAEVWDLEQEC